MPAFITISTVIGMLASLVLAIVVFDRGLRRLRVQKEEHVRTVLVVAFILFVWFALAYVLGKNGFFEVAPGNGIRIPNIVYTFVPLIVGTLALTFSKSWRRIVDAIPQQWIIGIQVYRTLGVFFLILYARQLLPAEFALPAGVGDILVGIAALPVAYLAFSRARGWRAAVIAWNMAGIADLALAVAMGFLTSPGPFQLLARGSPNEFITAFPLVLIPAFGVPLSNLLHIYSLRALYKGQKENAVNTIPNAINESNTSSPQAR